MLYPKGNMSKRTVRPPDRYLHENIEIAIDGKRAEDFTKPPREKERINVMATDMPTAVDVPMQAPHEAEKRK
ncbi:hypothetical protein EMCRGX_G012292 [Ephydatia muelleri]